MKTKPTFEDLRDQLDKCFEDGKKITEGSHVLTRKLLIRKTLEGIIEKGIIKGFEELYKERNTNPLIKFFNKIQLYRIKRKMRKFINIYIEEKFKELH